MKNISISLLLLIYYANGKPNISWCDYWHKLGIKRGECRVARTQAHQHNERFYAPEKSNTVLAMPICDVVTDWSRCQKADHCPLGYLCWVRGNPCCTPEMTNQALFVTNNQVTNTVELSTEPQCPSTKQLGIKCFVKNPVNWCYNDQDCHRTNSLQKCCPSGCNYNICVRTSKSIDMRQRMSVLTSIVPPQCPSLDSLPFGCASMGISWCNRDSDCLSNRAQQRHCCPTRCGYNVCLLRLENGKHIIA